MTPYLKTIFVVTVLLACGCSGGKKAETDPYAPIATTKSDAVTGKFTLLKPKDTGLGFVTQLQTNHELARLYHSVFAAGGLAIGDIDGDDVVDIFCAGGAQPNKLYKQTSPFKFVDITKRAGMASAVDAWSAGVSMVDIDNDSDLDLYVCNYRRPNQLWINDGQGKFSERASAYGVNIDDASVMAYFADFNNDRFLDLFLVTNRFYFEEGMVEKFTAKRLPTGGIQLEERLADYFRVISHPDGSNTLAPKGRPDFLFRNDGGRMFTDISRSSGITGQWAGNSAVIWDFDADNDLDIYVCNDGDDPDCLYENRGRGSFSNVTGEVFKQTSWFSKGCDIGDVNNDGLSDLVTIDVSGSTTFLSHILAVDKSAKRDFLEKAEPRPAPRNFLHINAGNCVNEVNSDVATRFLETAKLSGIESTDWSWAPIFADFDNDGFCDLFVTTGHIRNFNDPDVLAKPRDSASVNTYWNIFKDEQPFESPNVAFRNVNGLNFENVSAAWGIEQKGVSFAAAVSDLDRDGDLDLVTMNHDEPISVYRNDISNNNSLTIRLVGGRSNPVGIGAKIRVETEAGIQLKEFTPQRGLLASHEPLVQFGLGQLDRADKVTIDWPSGTVQSISNVEANQLLTLVEPDRVPHVEPAQESTQMFAQLSSVSVPALDERPFDDFERQPLLPYRLSKLGPGVAMADLSRDGKDELLLATPAWSGKTLGIRDVSESDDPDNVFFKTLPMPIDGSIDQGTPIFFDADGDEDLDIYVVNGGIEYKNIFKRLGDTLLVYEKDSGFKPIDRKLLPDTEFSGAAGAVADYDRDGDLDLFVGGRVVRGQYPTTPRSMLMRNETKLSDRPRFVDGSANDGEGLRLVGMVTGALWSDANNDGWIDLLVTTEWGPIRIFMNREGKLVETTAESGLEKYQGWWNGIAGGDFDNDGDIDYVVTNFGHNSRYTASQTQPLNIRFGRFGGMIHPRIVESKVTDDGEIPVRSKSELENAMPFIGDKFSSVDEFASARLSLVFSESELARAKKLSANELSTSLLVNDGQGKFELKPLPWMAQVAPGFGVVASDFDADGLTDVFVAQNFFSLRDVTERMAGGLSVLLLGTPSGEFDAVWPDKSGLAISADAKGVAISDLNEDLRPDLVVGINGDRPRFFANRSQDNVPIAIRLRGDKQNRHAIGARVEVELRDGSRQTAEIYAGSGYLSQSTRDLYFGLGDNRDIEVIRVRWPDGTNSDFVPPTSDELIRIVK